MKLQFTSKRIIGFQEEKVQIFLDELKICKERGERMKAIITDKQSITITQNSSLRSLTNLTKSHKQFSIILKNIVISVSALMLSFANFK